MTVHEVSDSCGLSGEEIWFAHPERTRVYGIDLWAGLSRINRYHGQFGPWSVLEHLALCSGLVRHHPAMADVRGDRHGRIVAAVCAHDLHEAYVLDLPTGLKRAVPGYAAIEDAWESHVHRSVGLPAPAEMDPMTRAVVKAVDWMALLTEMDAFENPRLPLAEARAGFAFDPAWRAEIRAVMHEMSRSENPMNVRERCPVWATVAIGIHAGCDRVGALPWSPDMYGWVG